ncbi:MAG: magnesium chelatase subunit D [Devosiaceae bacterium]|nr:magnesium chelatase subunit D [Devosiaceae bacterium MH13]
MWRDATLAIACVAVDPALVGGIAIRAHAGPVRDRLMALLNTLAGDDLPRRKVPPHCGDDRLIGGLDLPATLNAGRPVLQRGLIAEADGGLVVLPMAERADSLAITRLCSALDDHTLLVERDGLTRLLDARIGVVALDEGCEPGETVAPALQDRLAFRCDLTALSIRDLGPSIIETSDVIAARALLRDAEPQPELYETLTALAAAFGVSSLRAVLASVRVAGVIAALDGRYAAGETDIELAARLVIAPRATRLPQMQAEDDAEDQPVENETGEPEQQDPPPPQSADEERQDEHPPAPDGPLDDRVLEAVEAAIPADLLRQLQIGAALGVQAQASTGGQGAQRKALQRGRPLGARRGRLDGRQRLHLIETLRAAAPWQPLRRKERGLPEAANRLEIRSDDVRVRRYQERQQSVTIFVVDASGSAALHRLAEVKGAVELLLAESYARRDQVALIAFRGSSADLLLPPTRSLVRAKRCLSALPGGGGTPLAAALDAGRKLANDCQRQGVSAQLVLMTDGQANVGYTPGAGRAAARADAERAAAAFAGEGVPMLFIDTSPRRNPKAAELAERMGAIYLPLPHPNAEGIKAMVATAGAGPAKAQGRR